MLLEDTLVLQDEDFSKLVWLEFYLELGERLDDRSVAVVLESWEKLVVLARL